MDIVVSEVIAHIANQSTCQQCATNAQRYEVLRWKVEYGNNDCSWDRWKNQTERVHGNLTKNK